jgi:hypothetical protein
MSDSDSEPLDTGKDNFLTMIMDIIGGVQYKFLGALFLVFLFVTSDIFVLGALERISGAVEYKNPTPYGAVLQGVVLVLIMLVVDPLIRQKII